jgi:glyoxylase-like metal-dependent hydrolase (beta-lactamase superfamily II)
MLKILSVFSVCFYLLGCTDKVGLQQDLSPAQSMNKFCDKLPRPEYASLVRIEYADEWFELYQVAPGVTAIYEPNQWQEVISYLIEGQQKALLFDTGNGIGDIRKVVEFLSDKPIVVLNSHTHFDHVGGNYQFDNIYGLDTAFTRSRQHGHSPEQIGEEVSEAALCMPAPYNKTPSTHVGEPFTITQIVANNDIIDLGGRELQVLHIPGHTPDAIALVDKQNGLMWTGDSFYAGPIWLYADETNLTAYRKSLDIMIEQLPQIKTLLPAHNTPRVDPDVLIQVRRAFDDMLAGKLSSENKGGGMREYFPKESKGFSFLMRDEPLPYDKK